MLIFCFLSLFVLLILFFMNKLMVEDEFIGVMVSLLDMMNFMFFFMNLMLYFEGVLDLIFGFFGVMFMIFYGLIFLVIFMKFEIGGVSLSVIGYEYIIFGWGGMLSICLL